ncbi:helix-turn-helix transcriptional regulator [Stenotrophomonas sp. WHRI 8082]
MRAYRLKAGLSQAALAARLGISRQAVTALEKAPEAATFERLMKVWALLGIEVSLQEAASVADKRITTGLEW